MGMRIHGLLRRNGRRGKFSLKVNISEKRERIIAFELFSDFDGLKVTTDKK
jgi:hypothetical protein